ncbi:hypothetical protein HKX48_008584 [Thoreauomyces humboldtii]|nr:hypothetical protein HKX48_008584 [Thoreauomyces humboldtii]
MTTAAESHGIFQFEAPASGLDDNEDLIEALLAAEEDAAPAKVVRHFIDRSHVMRATTDGCFHPKSPSDIPTMFAEKTGPNALISSMEHAYVLKDYQLTITLATAFLAANNQRPSPLKSFEVVEILARAQMRLDKPDAAAAALDAQGGAGVSREPGWILLCAQVLRRIEGRLEDAMDALRRFDIARPNDPTVYMELAAVLEPTAPTLAMRALSHAKSLLTPRGRKAEDYAIATQHARHEIDALDRRIGDLLGRIAVDSTDVMPVSIKAATVEWIARMLPDAQGEVIVDDDEEDDGAKGLHQAIILVSRTTVVSGATSDNLQASSHQQTMLRSTFTRCVHVQRSPTTLKFISSRGIARSQSSAASDSFNEAIRTRLKTDLKAAMRAKNTLNTTVIKSVLSDITYQEKSASTSNISIATLLQRSIKKRQDAAEAFRTGGRDDLAAQEEKEAACLATYLPKQMTEEELSDIVRSAAASVGATSVKDLGKVMKEVNAKVDDSVAPKKLVADTVKRVLSAM